jgi:hypothetical protein
MSNLVFVTGDYCSGSTLVSRLYRNMWSDWVAAAEVPPHELLVDPKCLLEPF